jgi:exodeoxyribonuclease VII large subunit
MRFVLEDGMEVIVGGYLTVYERQGKYQLDAETIHPIGIGELQIAFEKLKNKLNKEGIFDEKHKKPLPKFPWTIGVVTSPTGAAIHDFVSVVSKRFPQVQIITNPVRVQGDGAALEISNAIKEFNDYGKVDLIVVCRGGGSLEDLWAFNEEIVARAIFASKIPVISAVGHEIDYNISDFVADKRAPTPSSAGEIAVLNKMEVESHINQLLKKIHQFLKDKIEFDKQKIQSIESSYTFRIPLDLFKQYSQSLDEILHRFQLAYKHKLLLYIENLKTYEEKLKNLDPLAVLKRGYSICYILPDEKIIKTSKELSINDEIKIKFYEGEASGKIKKIN